MMFLLVYHVPVLCTLTLLMTALAWPASVRT